MKLLWSLILARPRIAWGACTMLVAVACLWPFNFFQSNLVSWDPSGGLRFASPGIAGVTANLSSVRKCRAFTLLLDYSSEGKADEHDRRTIFGYCVDPEHRNFSLEEKHGEAIFRLSARGRRWPFELHFAYNPQESERWISITYDGQILGGAINGRMVKEIRSGHIDFSSWDTTYPVVVGNAADGKSPWQGELHAIALLDSAWPVGSLRGPDRIISRSSPLLLLMFDGLGRTMRSDRSRIQPVSIFLPQRFSPLRRAILKGADLTTPELRDILINVLGFIPLGFFTSLAYHPRTGRTGARLVMTVLVGLAVSLTMELLQAYLPTRTSSMNDVLSNAAGMIPGFFLGDRLARHAGTSAAAQTEAMPLQ